jgi:diadenosine tetraphosphate (Ap4A) HIT family hydrolase
MNTDFELHPQLAADTFQITTLQTCQVLLANDARFAWLILVPQVANLRDWHDVPSALQANVLDEVNQAAATLKDLTNAHKMNVAALGNQVAQLHIHVIARHQDDAAWPKPVWGEGTPQPYTDSARATITDSLLRALSP